MYVSRVNIENFRILEVLDIEPGRNMNLICGNNGAGKTSFIEALFVAGRGQSFRHREVRPWIKEGASQSRILVESCDQTGAHRVGIEQSRNHRRIRIDGADVKRRSDLARRLPLQLITPISHELIEKGPSARRRFLDWGLFHVEHEFHVHSLQFKRLLNQRNAALKNNDNSFTAWDTVLAESADYLENHRLTLLSRLTELINLELAQLSQPYRISTELKSNWDREKGALAGIKARQGDDLRSRLTQIGPHRSRIEFCVDGVPAERRLSRGQQKVLVYGMMLSLCQLIFEAVGNMPALLIDDLPAELDRENRETVISRIQAFGGQSFVSGIEFDSNAIQLADNVFHVEHGTLNNRQSQSAKS